MLFQVISDLALDQSTLLQEIDFVTQLLVECVKGLCAKSKPIEGEMKLSDLDTWIVLRHGADVGGSSCPWPSLHPPIEQCPPMHLEETECLLKLFSGWPSAAKTL